MDTTTEKAERTMMAEMAARRIVGIKEQLKNAPTKADRIGWQARLEEAQAQLRDLLWTI